jgi:protein-S-isoprenylcysteine O-methyltransferase Ste14
MNDRISRENGDPAPPWWKGARGEWLVIAQIILMLLILVGPRGWPGAPPWSPAAARLGAAAGYALIAIGVLLFIAGVIALGRNLTPVPHPRDNATLVQAGAYRLVRHPLYSGGLLMALGWALRVHGWLTLALVVITAVFMDIKARREERWLLAKFPEYAAYRKRVRRLIPFVY